MAFVAVTYALVWTLYAVVSKSSHDLHPDMAETVVLMREWALGYPKHPPFLIWLVASWFTVFPLVDWAYYLLAGVSLGFALYLSFVLAGEWLDGHKRAWVPFLLGVIPFYNFLALRFDHNALLHPALGFHHLGLHALARHPLLRVGRPHRSRRRSLAAHQILVGISGAGAGKGRRHSQEPRGLFPLAGALGGCIGGGARLRAPHRLARQNDFLPRYYVAGTRAAQSFPDWLRSVAEYSFGTAGYSAFACALFVAAVRPSRAAICDTLWSTDPQRRTAVILFWLPLLLPLLAAAITGTRLLSLWNMPALALLPVVLLMSPLIVAPRWAVVYTATIAVAISAAALVAAPLIAWWHLADSQNRTNYTRLLAAELAAEWKHDVATAEVRRRLVRASQSGVVLSAGAPAHLLSDRPSDAP